MLYSLAIEPLLQQIKQKVCGLCLPSCKNNIVLSAYADDVMVLISGQNDVQTLLKLIRDFMLLSSAKVNWTKCETLLVGQWVDGKPNLPDGLVWGKRGIKYLGVFLGDDVTQQKNWEGVCEKIKGRLEKWKWLIPNMSYRGRVLVVNNLAASSLWHRLACVDPPKQLLAKIQAVLVDFFWDKLHWVQQSILYLPKEGGGQGLMNLQSRTAAFRLQFLQRFFDGASDVSWRAAASAILQNFGGFGLDKHLFLMNPLKMDFSKMPYFYKNLFKVWSLFQIQKTESSYSLHWLLEEPLIFGARLDITNNCNLNGLSSALQKSRAVTLGQMLILAGPNLENAEMASQHLGIRSVRLVSLFLFKLRSALTDEENQMLKDYNSGTYTPNAQDLFPCLEILPNLDGCTGLVLKNWQSLWLDLLSTKGNLLYRACVMAFNKTYFERKVDTPWRSFFWAR